MQNRIEAMRAQVDALCAMGLRKTTLPENVAQSLRETRGEAREMRRAKAFAHHLSRVDTPVYPAERLIGSITGMWPVDDAPPTSDEYRAQAREAIARARDEAPMAEDTAAGFFDRRVFAGKSRFAIMARDHYDASIPYPVLQRLIREMADEHPEFSYAEIGKILENRFVYDYGEETRRLMEDLPWDVANHTHLNYQKVLRLGFGGILAEIEGKMPEDPAFYGALAVSVNAAIAFIRRYARAALAAAETQDAARAKELRESAARMRKIARGAPETFYEAMQLVWLTHLIANLGGGSALSFARFDQYMYPFYEKDLREGRITQDDALEWICGLWLKMNEPKMRTVQSLCLGGVTRGGENAANALTRVCLRATKLLKLPYPNVSVRCDARVSPSWLLPDAVDCVCAGGGMPMLLNDETWVANLVSVGLSPADARDYYNMGCVEMMVSGCMPNWVGAPGIGFARAVNETLYEIADASDAPATFEGLLSRVLARMREKIARARDAAYAEIARQANFCRDPFASALVDGCVESGRDYFAGGTRLGAQVAVGALGLGTAADSLGAIRETVYRRGQYALLDVVRAMRENFANNPAMRARLSRCAAYGNDLDEPDDIAKALFDAYADAVRALNRPGERVRFVTNVFSYHSHISEGERLGATANGRLAGESVSDCVGPTQGRDALGPTCMLNSALKLDMKGVTGAYALNMKLAGSVVQGEKGLSAALSLVRAYFRRGGAQLQINFANADEMREAQARPEAHANLVVRIAGYCEYFINLDAKLQNEIIRRTTHEIA